MVALVASDTLGSKLGVAAVQTDFSARRDQRPHNREEPVAGCNRQWGVERVVVTENVRVGLGAKKCMHGVGVTAANGIHERGVSLAGLKFQVGLALNETLRGLSVSLHRRIHERRDAVTVLGVDVARQREQAGNLVSVAVVGGGH